MEVRIARNFLVCQQNILSVTIQPIATRYMKIDYFACRSPFLLFQPKHDVKLLLMLTNKLCRLLNMKRRLSVFYYIVELL